MTINCTNDARKGLSGLRKVATLQTLANAAKPRERHQMANRFARLENERARLEREVSAWENRMQATALRLAKVNDEIEALRPSLLDPAHKESALRKGRGRRSPVTEAQVREPLYSHHTALTLEY